MFENLDCVIISVNKKVAAVYRDKTPTIEPNKHSEIYL